MPEGSPKEENRSGDGQAEIVAIVCRQTTWRICDPFPSNGQPHRLKYDIRPEACEFTDLNL